MKYQYVVETQKNLSDGVSYRTQGVRYGEDADQVATEILHGQGEHIAPHSTDGVRIHVSLWKDGSQGPVSQQEGIVTMTGTHTAQEEARLGQVVPHTLLARAQTYAQTHGATRDHALRHILDDVATRGWEPVHGGHWEVDPEGDGLFRVLEIRGDGSEVEVVAGGMEYLRARLYLVRAVRRNGIEGVPVPHTLWAAGTRLRKQKNQSLCEAARAAVDEPLARKYGHARGVPCRLVEDLRDVARELADQAADAATVALAEVLPDIPQADLLNMSLARRDWAREAMSIGLRSEALHMITQKRPH